MSDKEFDRIDAPEGITATNNSEILFISIDNKHKAILLFFLLFPFSFFLIFVGGTEKLYLYTSIGIISFLLSIVLINFINKVIIKVTDDILKVETRPFPTIFKKKYKSEKIYSITIKCEYYKDYSPDYNIIIKFKNKKEDITLISFKLKERAIFVRDTISIWLGIKYSKKIVNGIPYRK